MAKTTSLRSGAAYIRVSTDKQEELSPDAQRRLIIDYAKKNGILLSDKDIFVENGISGKKADKRPMFQQMIALAKSKEHPYDVILVWKFSRFARNQDESILYKSLLRKKNIDVVSISEPIIDGPFGSLIERIIEWMDEYYSINLSSEVRRGMTEKAPDCGHVAETLSNSAWSNISSAIRFISERYAGTAQSTAPTLKMLRKISSSSTVSTLRL